MSGPTPYERETFGDAGDWTDEVEIQPAGPVESAVVSARLPRHLVDQLNHEAERRSVRLSAIVREALEVYLTGGDHSGGAVSDVMVGSTIEGVKVGVFAGRRTTGLTVGSPAELELSGGPRAAAQVAASG